MTASPNVPASRHATDSSAQTRGSGARLREQRRSLGWSLAEAEKSSGVREKHLGAIERGQPDELPAPGYALGYVRAYARALGLDADGVVAEYKRELSGRPSRRTAAPRLAISTARRLPRGTVPALAVVGAVVALGAWYGVQLDPDDMPAPVPADMADMAGGGDVSAVADDVVTLRASAPSWVSIRNSRGDMVANRVFVSGERWQAEGGEDYVVSVRDGGAVELFVGERSQGPLGEGGEPVADFAVRGVGGR